MQLPLVLFRKYTFVTNSGIYSINNKVKRQVSSVTGPWCPEGSWKLRFLDYVALAQDGGKVVSLTHRPLFTPRKYSWYSFLLEADWTPGP